MTNMATMPIYGNNLKEILLQEGQIWSLMLLYVKTINFSETIVVYDLKLATADWSDEKFLLTSKLCPLGLSAPCPGAIYMH